ncbi:DMT family transporter [Leifsonia shinshuensis]|uniref:EamA family transporter n=1 Tax=Leifsonia shinshuensis TaxID=150026 RepID=UPI001F511819|nr:DMT family transporter [Leifsonia shinshuensis]MCI0157061.1 DMT family transporter [Leifsonia shinshuensis]
MAGTSTNHTTRGLVVAVIAAASFGLSGAFIKPLLESGWSPAAAVSARVLIGGAVLAPFAAVALRGRWSALWRGRWRALGMALIGVASTQVLYFAAIERIPVSTAILIEYLAPVVLVLLVWARTRRAPRWMVLAGSGVAIAGLLLVVAPGGGRGLDLVGVTLAVTAMLGCAGYYVIAARPADGLPPVALAAVGLLLGGVALLAVSATGLLPFVVSFRDVELFGGPAPWWVPLAVVGVLATALAYAAGITAAGLLGSRLSSFAGLLEVVAATLYAWLLLGESLGALQLVGGVLILAGIALVRADPTPAPTSIAHPEPSKGTSLSLSAVESDNNVPLG